MLSKWWNYRISIWRVGTQRVWDTDKPNNLDPTDNSIDMPSGFDVAPVPTLHVSASQYDRVKPEFGRESKIPNIIK